MLSKTLKIIVLLLLLLFCFLMVRLSAAYISMRYDVDFLLTKQSIIHIKHWRYAFYTHVFLSIFAMLAGFTQFSGTILKKYKRLHRVMGYVYVADILILAGPSALIMAFYANGFFNTKISFVVLSLLWMLFTAMALVRARKRDFEAHRQWMIRSFALTLSAVTLRLLAMVLPHFVHMGAREEYNFISWASWLINLFIAEVIIVISAKKSRSIA